MVSNQVLFGVIILVCMFALAMLTISNTLNATQTTAAPKTIKIASGGGNSSAPWTLFLPQNITINAGDSVMWYNPTVGRQNHIQLLSH
ncbi:MAG: hypothetical protein GEU26_15600 [Nitrososphaeraceae archaeon]|nr:hypothetical protein [Nitrososphaeraceae archaeon]